MNEGCSDADLPRAWCRRVGCGYRWWGRTGQGFYSGANVRGGLHPVVGLSVRALTNHTEESLLTPLHCHWNYLITQMCSNSIQDMYNNNRNHGLHKV